MNIYYLIKFMALFTPTIFGIACADGGSKMNLNLSNMTASIGTPWVF